MQKKILLVCAFLVGFLPSAVALEGANAAGAVSASVSVQNVRYDGYGNCVRTPVTMSVTGGVSNGFAYWNTENAVLVGPTSSPSPVSFFFDNEDAPATEWMQMCALFDHPGIYTYSADVWFHNWSDQGGDQYAGRVSATFSVSLAPTGTVKVGRHSWQVRVVGQPSLVPYPKVRLQRLKGRRWKTLVTAHGNSAGRFNLKPRSAGKYRLVYGGDVDRGIQGSTSKVFRRP